MKKVLYFSLMLMLSAPMVLLTSCDKDEDATCTDGIQNGDEAGVDCGGDCADCPTCSDGIMNGDEEGVDCGGTACDACKVGVQSSWQSSGANVAPLLVNLFATDSIWADFKTNNTFVVHQFDTSGTMLVLEGTYTQSESSVAGIWDITLNQTTPGSLTSVGILSVTGDEMKYEIVQTEPDIGAVPPTADGGFGSTNGGQLGTLNVQTYLRVE